MLFFLFSLWISIHPASAGMNSGNGWGLAWFVVLYFLAAWFRLYYTTDQSGKERRNIYILSYILIAAAVSVTYVFVGTNIPIVCTVVGNWYRYDSVPVYIETLCLFAAFLNLNIKNQFITRSATILAPATLGVYLIHAHASFSPWVWEILDMPAKMNSAWFPMYQIRVVFAIYFGCTVVDVLRRCTVGQVETSSFIMGICRKLTKMVNTMFKQLDWIA